jgi:hypothetical protein
MKQFLIFTLTIFSLTVYGQDKYNYVHFNKLTEVVGTEYVIASIENWGKMFDTKSRYLLFINTKTGQSKQVDFPNDGYMEKVEQVKIDSLGINKIFVSAQTVDLDGKGGIDWQDPKQFIILSTDGQEKTQLTVSRPEIGLHELTCKQDEKIRKNSSGTRGYHCGVFAGRYDLS